MDAGDARDPQLTVGEYRQVCQEAAWDAYWQSLARADTIVARLSPPATGG